jgi:hypothetical protein
MTNHASPSAAPPIPAAAPRSNSASVALNAGDLRRIAAAIDAELADSTRTAYASAWRQWDTWCRGRELVARHAAPEALAAHLAERAEPGICFGTLDGYCAAIGHRHLQEGLSDPTAEVVVRRVRRGLRRIMGTAPHREAHPLTVAEGQVR